MIEFVKGKGWRARASWYDATGNRHQKQKQWFAKKRDALDWERAYLDKHGDLQPDADKITVQQWCNKYLQLHSGVLADNTVSGYTNNCKRICKYIGAIQLCKLRRIDVEIMLKSMLQERVRGGKPIGAATVKYCLRTLHAALNCAVDNEYIKKNPADGAKMPICDDRFVPKVLSADQGREMLAILKKEDGQLYLAALLSIVYGLRLGEAIGLRWQDVDAREIRVRGQYTQSSNGDVYKAALKTSSSYRTLAMHPYVWSELQAVDAANKKMGRIATYICELDGELPGSSKMSARWARFAKRHGYDGVRYHDLRHSSATMMLQGGADINTVKSQLGHAKISTTELYLHSGFTQSVSAAESVVSSIFSAKNKETKKTSG